MEVEILLLRLITLNVRMKTTRLLQGEQPWEVRCPLLCSQLRFVTAGHEAPFLCLQEVLSSQLFDINSQLEEGPGARRWARIGLGRDDGATAGEFSPIFYRPDDWDCDHDATWWLSETPLQPSRGWDAALNRVVTMGVFSHRRTRVRVMVMSTHFDHLGQQARENSAKLILALAQSAREKLGDDDIPLFLGGDLNSTPDSAAYKAITDPDHGGMTDISKLVRRDRHYGNPAITYTSFGQPDAGPPARIDFLFTQHLDRLAFLHYGVLPNRFDDGVYLSDHRAVVADVEIHTPSV